MQLTVFIVATFLPNCSFRLIIHHLSECLSFISCCCCSRWLNTDTSSPQKRSHCLVWTACRSSSFLPSSDSFMSRCGSWWLCSQQRSCCNGEEVRWKENLLNCHCISIHDYFLIIFFLFSGDPGSRLSLLTKRSSSLCGIKAWWHRPTDFHLHQSQKVLLCYSHLTLSEATCC